LLIGVWILSLVEPAFSPPRRDDSDDPYGKPGKSQRAKVSYHFARADFPIPKGCRFPLTGQLEEIHTMRVHIGQIYIEPGVMFPFTHVFQKHLSELLTSHIPKEAFVIRFGDGYDLIFNVSAKKDLVITEIKGPAVFKRYKTVEYTVFLPGRVDALHDKDSLAGVICLLLSAIQEVLGDLGMPANLAAVEVSAMAREIVENPAMIRQGSIAFAGIAPRQDDRPCGSG
jgi:hypothetical protein